jgi:hypothetical protein
MSTVHPRVCGERDSLAIWTIAAEKVGRACRELELIAPCVDVIARRYEPLTGAAAIPIETARLSAIWRRGARARPPIRRRCSWSKGSLDVAHEPVFLPRRRTSEIHNC